MSVKVPLFAATALPTLDLKTDTVRLWVKGLHFFTMNKICRSSLALITPLTRLQTSLVPDNPFPLCSSLAHEPAFPTLLEYYGRLGLLFDRPVQLIYFVAWPVPPINRRHRL